MRYSTQAGEEATGQAVAGLRAHLEAVERAGAVHWKLVIRIALVVATLVGVLSTFLAAGSVLWVAAGAVIVLGIYRRKRPQALLNPRVGARIGVLVGMIAASVALAGNAVLLLVQRFGLRQGGQIDLQLDTIVRQAAEHATSMDPQAPVASFTSFWLSAEGKSGLVLLTMAFLSLLIVLFAIAGGVLGAQIYRYPGDQAHS
ncbi:MAG TPA: hypothetical protein VFN53_07250 [Acidobacteriaceae bacterium]|nr:hypothetical protein [Acidobacteriaceae bacterium]